MNKQEFLNTFQRAMDALGVKDKKAHYAFFEELFDDMAEEGVTETEISERLGNPWELAASLLREEMGGVDTGGPMQRPAASADVPPIRQKDAEARDTEQAGRSSAKLSWREGLNKLLNTAGIRFSINAEQFGGYDSYETVLPFQGIQELEIHWLAGELQVVSENRSDILLTEDRNAKASPMKAEVRGECLCIFYAQDGVARGSKDLTVTLPSELAANLRSCTIQTLSADTSLEGVYAHELTVKTASGQQNIRARADQASFTSASGDLELELEPGSRVVTATTTSGDLTLETADAEAAKLSTASGDVRCEGSFRQLSMNSASGDLECSGNIVQVQAKTASGDCYLDFHKEPEEINVSTVSGDVEITLPHGAACNLQLNSRTGDVSFSGIRTDAENAPTYRVQTVSGDIDIHD